MNRKNKIGIYLLSFFAVVAIIGISISDVIKQDEAYHCFSDAKPWLGIPNFWNVVSNLPYLIVGVLGLRKYSIKSKQYFIFFCSMILIAFGSSYYHWNPNNVTLVWDRLPMTLAFMSIVSIIISEFISLDLGKKLVFPFLLIGLSSVMYWVVFDDLRFYALVQFYPMVAVPIIMLTFESSYTMTKGYWLLFLSYFLAKLCEHYDHQIHHALHIISGHTIKHVVSAIGVYMLYDAYTKREYVGK